MAKGKRTGSKTMPVNPPAVRSTRLAKGPTRATRSTFTGSAGPADDLIHTNGKFLQQDECYLLFYFIPEHLGVQQKRKRAMTGLSEQSRGSTSKKSE